MKWLTVRTCLGSTASRTFQFEELKLLKEYIELFPDCKVYEIRWEIDPQTILDYGT